MLLLVLGSFVIHFISEKIRRSELEIRQERLESINKQAVGEFSESLQSFVSFMSGVRSYLKLSEELPTEKELFQFVKHQLAYLDYQDSLVISLLDPSHTFLYSFDRNAINPNDLVGMSVASVRDEQEIARLDALLQDEDFHLFPALNLVEGWVGMPLNFSLVRDSTSIGYIAALINAKSLINAIYVLPNADQFVFRFWLNDQLELDREQVDDGSRIYHNREDSLSYKNFQVSEVNYIKSNFSLYNLKLTIGTAYRSPHQKSFKFTYLLAAWFSVVGLFGFYALYNLNRYEKLTNRLVESNALTAKQASNLHDKNLSLVESAKVRDKIFSIIGHDLKAPLNSFSAVIGLNNAGRLTPDELAGLISKLDTVTGNALNLLDNLLKWAMISTGQITKSVTEFSINQVINESYGLLKPSFERKKIVLEVSILKLAIIETDYNMFSFVIRNFLANALKFSNSNSKVLVSSESKNDRIIISVQDFGIGMDEKEESMLFTPFFATKIGTSGEKGTGLGLVITKEFATSIGGKVEVTSKLGEGSIFSLILPLKN